MKEKIYSKFIIYILLIIVTIIMITPLIWLVTTSFKTKSEIFSQPFNVFPEKLNFNNFTNAWSYAPFSEYYINTIIISFGLLFIQLIMITMAAFAFARIDFPGRELFLHTVFNSIDDHPTKYYFP